MSLDVLIRRATQDDVPEILLHRRGMYEDMDYNDGDALSSMLSTCAPYLTTALANGSFQSWLGLIGERIVAGGAILINPWPSHPYDLECTLPPSVRDARRTPTGTEPGLLST